jgi:DNA repair photolyase
MNRVHDMRGAKDYDSNLGSRMKGEGVWAALIKQRAEKAIRRFGMEKRGSRFRQLDAIQFQRP